jgi:hypothetical protein
VSAPWESFGYSIGDAATGETYASGWVDLTPEYTPDASNPRVLFLRWVIVSPDYRYNEAMIPTYEVLYDFFEKPAKGRWASDRRAA